MASTELDLEPDVAVKSSAEVRALLRRKFPADQFAMLYEVRDAAGFGATRSADALMVGLWPSRGCLIEGMEIKVSRSDWLQELKKPKKAEAFVPYCDKWWVVVGNKDIVKPGELPATWGLMVAGGRGISIVTDAPRLNPEPIDRSLLAAILKRATTTVLNDPEVAAVIDAKVKAARETFSATNSHDLKRVERDKQQLEKAIQAFEDASGVKIDTYRGEQIGKAVKAVLALEHNHRISEAMRLRDRIKDLHEYMQREFPDDGSDSNALAEPSK